jgi:hypothetical protein
MFSQRKWISQLEEGHNFWVEILGKVSWNRKQPSLALKNAVATHE